MNFDAPAIGSLDVSYNRLQMNPHEASAPFAPFANTLRRLQLNGNGGLVTTLPNRAFGELHHLEDLDLSGNTISGLRRRSFHGLERVQLLNLSRNDISQLQPEQFAAMKRLRVLDLSANRMFAIGAEAFARSRLEWLDVSDNRLTEWPSAALGDVGFTMRSIAVRSNRLTRLDGVMLAQTPFVRDVDVAGNQLEAINVSGDGENGGVSVNLTRLDVGGNPRLASILMQMLQQTDATALRSMRELCVADLGLTALPSRLADSMPDLTMLDVQRNRLQTLPPSVRNLRQLHTLRMAGNRLVNWAELVQRMTLSLRTLDVSDNVVLPAGNR